MPSYSEAPDVPHFESTIEGMDDPHVFVGEQNGFTVWDATNGQPARPLAEVAQPMVSWDPHLQPSVHSLPPCRAPIPDGFTLNKEELETYLHQLHSLCNRLKKRVKILEQISGEHYETMVETFADLE